MKKTIIPSRALFFNPKSFSNVDGSEHTSPSSIDLLAPLAEARDAEMGESVRGANTHGALWPISMFFHIAVQSLPRITPKQRSVEDSWLQELFGRLLQFIFDFNIADTPSIFSAQHTSTLKQMLQEIADQNIRISSSKLEHLLGRIISCLDNASNGSELCELISLCIAIDANIFLIPAPVAKDRQENGERVPNHRLAALLLWITTSAWKKSPERDLMYEAKLSKVVLPLVEAFAKARDLLGFVQYWLEQLAVSQKQPSDQAEVGSWYYRPRTLWEDERLLQLIARLAESTLTGRQINDALLKAHAGMASYGYPSLIPNLVFLDSALSIALDDAKSDQIADAAWKIYHSTLDGLLNASNWATEHRWRLWRILFTFKQRLFLPKFNLDIRSLERQVIDKGAELTTRTRIRPSNNEGDQYDYAEELYAFGFILSSNSGRKQSGEDEEQRSKELIEAVLVWVSESGARQRNNDEPDQIASAENTEPVPRWNGHSDAVKSLDTLHLGYSAQFLVFPDLLRLDNTSLSITELTLTVTSFVDVMDQHRFFQKIYEAAVAFITSPHTYESLGDPLSASINYLSLWDKLLNSGRLQENHTLASSEPLDFQKNFY